MRRAVIASVAIHIALAAIAITAILSLASSRPQSKFVDTNIREVSLAFDTSEPIALATPSEAKADDNPAPVAEAESRYVRTPTITNVPSALSAEMLASIHRYQNLEVPKYPNSSRSDTNVHVVSATEAAVPGAIHGAMKPGQSIVYILDCSGSMGEFGKLALARAALIATLERQPEGVRFQVIVYSSDARQLFSGGLSPVVANLSTAKAKLAALESSGRSNHAEALRAAVALLPDAILWLTDADDLSPARLKLISVGAGKTIPIFTAHVGAEIVAQPRELR